MTESTLAIRLRFQAKIDAVMDAFESLRVASRVLLEEAKSGVIRDDRSAILAQVSNQIAQAMLRATIADKTDWDEFAKSMNLTEQDYVSTIPPKPVKKAK